MGVDVKGLINCPVKPKQDWNSDFVFRFLGGLDLESSLGQSWLNSRKNGVTVMLMLR